MGTSCERSPSATTHGQKLERKILIPKNINRHDEKNVLLEKHFRSAQDDRGVATGAPGPGFHRLLIT